MQKVFHQRLQEILSPEIADNFSPEIAKSSFLPKIPDILNSLTTNTTIIQKPVTGFAEQNFRFANFLCERNIGH